jgi:hypothetical protein
MKMSLFREVIYGCLPSINKVRQEGFFFVTACGAGRLQKSRQRNISRLDFSLLGFGSCFSRQRLLKSLPKILELTQNAAQPFHFCP